MTLTEFLLARIAEDEDAARRAGSSAWLHRSLYRHLGSRQSVYAEDREIAEVEHTDGWHIARHDPARVLAECEAKRRIVRNAQAWEVSGHPMAREYELVMRMLALPYADHPGYRQEWRP